MKRKRFPAACVGFPAITESVRAAQRIALKNRPGEGKPPMPGCLAGDGIAMSHVAITGFDLTIDGLVRISREKAPVSLTAEAVERMKAARAVVDDAVARGEKVYGVTTSVGNTVDMRA